jgi:hypothetical protein
MFLMFCCVIVEMGREGEVGGREGGRRTLLHVVI